MSGTSQAGARTFHDPGSIASSGDVTPRSIRVTHLTKHFPGQVALNDVSLQIDPSGVHALLGENGSGKSTLIKILAGVYVPEPEGQIFVGDTELPTGSPRASFDSGFRFVHQDLGLVYSCTGLENIAFGTGYVRSWGRIAWRRHEAHCEQLMARVGVSVDLRRTVAQLQPIERSAIAIARAIDTRGDTPISLMVLDEPTAALPHTQVDRLFNIIESLRREGVAILYVSHRLNEILEIAHHVTVLRDGSVQASRTAEGLNRQLLVSMVVGPQLANAHEVAPPDAVTATAARESATAIVRVRGLTSPTLQGIDLDVAPGEILGLAGLLGSGRQEVVHGLFGAIPATFDSVEIAGKPLRSLTPRSAIDSGIALVQSNRMAGSGSAKMTARENFFSVMGGGRGKISHRCERKILLDWMHRTTVRPPFTERPFSQFSGGNQQKILIAKWLHTYPKVLFLDEPTLGVDVGARKVIHDLVKEYAVNEGLGVVISSADLEDFVGICSRVLVFNRGRITAELVGATQIQEETIMHELAAGPISTTA
jgi:ribose transport system ATP-binding protein